MASSTADTSIEKMLSDVFRGRHIFLHGPGGVGKSYRLRHIVKALTDKRMNVYVTATTGVAAVGLSDQETQVIASTLHRFAGVGTAALPASSLITKVKNNFKCRRRWETCNVLVIDEVSMLGADFFKKLCAIAQAVRNNYTEPMGGIQLILSGDFLQLPPVKDDWIFRTAEWESLNIRPYILETPYRYDCNDFFQLLLRVRKGTITEEDSKTIRRRVRANQKMQTLLAELTDANPADVIKPTMFFSRRDDVESFNNRELAKLDGELVEFVAADTFVRVDGSPNVEDYQRMLDEEIPRSISFKVGAQVMLRVNLDTEGGLVNGSRGVVCEIVPGEAMIVKFLNGAKLRIDMQKREIEDKYAIASRTQIPFMLAYAMTIHKSQGSTLDYCVVDLGPSVFAEGQAYVALSRCGTKQGLFISEFSKTSIKANKIAVAYSARLEAMAAKEDTE